MDMSKVVNRKLSQTKVNLNQVHLTNVCRVHWMINYHKCMIWANVCQVHLIIYYHKCMIWVCQLCLIVYYHKLVSIKKNHKYIALFNDSL